MFSRQTCLLLLFYSITLLGCDGVPRLPVVNQASVTPLSSDVVSQQGRGSYDWYYLNGEFEVAAISELAVFENLDLDRIKERIPPLTYKEPAEPFRPEGMGDEAYRYFSRFTEPYFDTQPFLVIPFVTEESGQYSVDANGDRLALLNGGNLEIWDLSKSKVLSKLPLSSSKPTRLSWSHDQAHVLVVDESGILSLSAESGKTTNRWQPPDADSPMLLVHAGKTPTYAVSTKNGRLYILDEQLRTTNSYNGRAIDSSMVSIRPDGQAVIGIVEREIIQWNLQPTQRNQIESLGKLDANESVTGLISGTNFHYIIEPVDFYSVQVGENIQAIQYPLNRLAHAVCMGTVDYSDEFLTGCLSRRNIRGEQEFFLQDFFLQDRAVSLEFPLGNEPIVELVTSRNTNVFAVRDKEKLRVFKRQRWKIDKAGWTANDVRLMVLSGEFEQAELLAQELGKMPRTRAMTGYSLYAYIAAVIGESWAGIEEKDRDVDAGMQLSIEDKEENRRLLAVLERWRKTESELSVLASAYRHFDAAWNARGKGYASSVSRNNWNEYEKRLASARKEIDLLLAKPNPGFSTLCLSISVGLSEGKSHDEQAPIIKQFLENCIFDISTHASICLHLLPRWGGNPGESGAYLASAVDLLPQPHSDILYTKVAVRFYQNFKSAVFMKSEGGLSISRVLRAIDSLIQERALWTHEAETLIELCDRTQRADLVKRLIVYCLENDTLTLQLQANALETASQTDGTILDAVLKPERDKMLRILRGEPSR